MLRNEKPLCLVDEKSKIIENIIYKFVFMPL